MIFDIILEMPGGEYCVNLVSGKNSQHRPVEALYIEKHFMISPTKRQQLKNKMQLLGILETDLVEKFILGSGRGGQKIQKSSTCVYLHHLPSGIEIKCQKTRSQEENRFYARRRLCEKIDEQINQEKSLRQQEIEKVKQQKRRRSRKTKLKILAAKTERSQLKQSRQKPKFDE